MSARALLAAFAATALLAVPAAANAQRGQPDGQTGRMEGTRSNGPSQTDWTRTAERTPENGFRIGNPNARIKLIEYLSLSCEHCARFAFDSAPRLYPDYVRRGQVSVEYRNFVLNGFDMAAAMISRCAAPRAYFDMTHYLLGNQPRWLGRAQGLTDAQRNELRGLQPLQAMQRLVAMLGLDAIAARHGITPAGARACLSQQGNLDQIAALQTGGQALGVNGTPTFFINGVAAPTNTWAGIEPLLRGR
jgi:protein-disulfide isomerase